MVDMLAEDSSLSIRAAAQAVTKGLPGTQATHVERLRKRYRALKQRGQLPPQETEASRLAQRQGAIRAMYEQRENRIEQFKKDLAMAEARARALNLETTHPNLGIVIHALEELKQRLEVLAVDSPHTSYDFLLHQGITDPEQALQTVSQAAEQLPVLTEKINLLKTISRLRSVLGLPS